MKLTELEPIWITGADDQLYLEFLCPKCPREAERYDNCIVMLPVSTPPKLPKHWEWNGEHDFDKVTTAPSIAHHCKSEPHFFIRNGQIDFA